MTSRGTLSAWRALRWLADKLITFAQAWLDAEPKKKRKP